MFCHSSILPLHSCCQGQSASGMPSSLWWIFVLCQLCSLKASFFWDFLSPAKDCLPLNPPQCSDFRVPGGNTLASESACNCQLYNKTFSYFLFASFQRSKKSFIWKESRYMIIYFALKIIFWVKSNSLSKACARHCSQIRTLLGTSLEVNFLLRDSTKHTKKTIPENLVKLHTVTKPVVHHVLAPPPEPVFLNQPGVII